MDLARLRYLLLVLLLFSTRPSFGQDFEERPQEDHSQAALFLSQYVQIPSVTGAENEAGSFLASACYSNGMHVHIFTDAPGSFNFAASLYPLSSGKPNIVFLTHIDVVPEGDHSLWTYPPYSGTIADGHLWGRGAFDNKGHGVMQLFALAGFVEEAARRDFPFNFTLLAVSGEETDGEMGAKLIAEEFLQELNPVVVYGEGGIGIAGISQAYPDQVIFGIEVAQKRPFWLRLQSNGAVFGHGSVPSPVYPARQLSLAMAAILNGKNKVVLTPLVLNMFNDIGNHEKGFRKLALKNYRFFSPFISKKVSQEELMNSLLHNTITLTNLGSSEGAFNQMAQEVWATFDARLLPGTSTEAYLKKLNGLVKEYEVEFTIIKECPLTPVSDTGPFYQALQKAILETFGDVPVVPMLLPASNDNVFFRAKGVPVYGLVPAIFKHEHVQSIHNIDERLPLTALEEGIEVYSALIRILSTQLIARE
jgi:carboxypeptidase PM20D1